MMQSRSIIVSYMIYKIIKCYYSYFDYSLRLKNSSRLIAESPA